MTEFSDDAYWKCPYTGKLFFGGINGVIWVDPQNDRQENYKPALHFFEMKMGHETHSLYDYTDQKTGYVTIPPNISTFSISFVATDYISRLYYSYLTEKAYATAQKHWEKDELDEEDYARIQQHYEETLPVAAEILLNADSITEAHSVLSSYLTDEKIASLYAGNVVRFHEGKELGAAV